MRRLLLDTHALLWWLDGDKRLPEPTRHLIGDTHSEVWVSAASAWEIATKVRIGKLPGAIEVAQHLDSILQEQGFAELPISIAHARRAGLVTSAHRDPFDRMLIAQAEIEELELISNEELFDSFQIKRTW